MLHKAFSKSRYAWYTRSSEHTTNYNTPGLCCRWRRICILRSHCLAISTTSCSYSTVSIHDSTCCTIPESTQSIYLHYFCPINLTRFVNVNNRRMEVTVVCTHRYFVQLHVLGMRHLFSKTDMRKPLLQSFTR